MTTKDQGPGTRDSSSRVREITAILVSWKDEEDVLDAVASLALARQRIQPGGPRVSLLLVDNGGGLRDRSGILASWPGACLLVNESNEGFGPAANQAAEKAPGDVLLFVNPDTRAEGDVFCEIAKALDAHPEAAALAPRLLDFDDPDPQSKIQNPES
ncbi:MAG TPA: glycosyltransferase, partial [Thermoanaerobaculia bacterium]|nr:glycosyltransferase [Thermoanaerobaculia bacterium]